jgi:hypothetical protein
MRKVSKLGLSLDEYFKFTYARNFSRNLREKNGAKKSAPFSRGTSFS